ncbi:hypothetical protein PPYR_00945 [Photinus pyralis]|uniref:Uncharacterized protein n=1 Tax=Photinus pyralis TaxID=7054 RepID=A0A1Y1MUD2_PHOPY|nr:uncharacterized protein LOC116159373 [Photinus pyralis]KAB0803975.1 hypothetical protein PPYR_00945 [Photinus pyralis]
MAPAAQPKTEFKTPISIMKSKEQAWAKLERAPFPAPDLTKLKTMTYFDNPINYEFKQEYDHFFAFTKTLPLFDHRKRTDNRAYPADIREHIFQQEKRKAVPATTSLVYGRPCRVQIDFPMMQYFRQAEIASMYRRSGVMPPIERELI